MALEQWIPVSRKGGGDWYTGSFLLPTGVKKVEILLDVNPVDFDISDLSVNAIVEYSPDNEVSWIHVMTASFIGGPPPLKGGQWRAGCNGLETLAGLLLRVHFVTVGTFRWGLQGELL